jgi:glycosyltransferase involved in cell wall biosynthesis
MKIVVDPADETGCGYYRLIWAARHLQEQGHDVNVRISGTTTGVLLQFADREKTVISDFKITRTSDASDENPEEIECDVYVVQRVSHAWHQQLIPLMRKKGISVIVDMDDDLSAVDPGNSAHMAYSKRSRTPFTARYAETCCKVASWVTVSTQNLMNVYARHRRGTVIDNYIPDWVVAGYPPPPTGDKPTFGWPGITWSHPADLQGVGRSAQQLIDAGYQFKVVGPPSEVKQRLRLNAEPEYTGRVPIAEWVPTVGNTLDVVMAPLDLSSFNSSKSRLKVLEANAAGRAWVASPRTEYRRYQRESGGGLLANTPREWFQQLKKLLDDEPMRQDMAAQGLKFAATQTIGQNSWRWLEAWTNAYKVDHPREVLV